MTAKEKLIKARAALVLDQPFFGSLVLRLKPQEDLSCNTLWVDGTNLGFSPKFVDSLSMDQLKGCLCHEVLHCALAHHARRGDRDGKKWNVAADYAVNPVIKDKFSLPDGFLFDPAFNDLSAENIYSKLPQEESGKDDQGQDGSGNGDSQEDSSPGSDSGQGQDPGGCGEVRDAPAEDGSTPGSEADLSKSEAEWKVAVAQAAQQAKSFGKLPAGIDRIVEEIINPRVDWRSILRYFMDTVSKSDYSWSPPNRRHIHSNIYLPSCRNTELGTVIIAVDTSGSIDDETLNKVAAELSGILNDVQAEAHVIYCDAEIQNVEYFGPGDFLGILNAKGGGGTDFRPVFDWIEKENISPSCLIYFTDLDGEFPESDPGFPVLWIVEGKTFESAPFGEILEI